jgi:hypothetical protein
MQKHMRPRFRLGISTAHLREQNSSIGWGGVDSRAVCIATGRLCGVTFCKSKSNKWSKVLITSGINDAWVIPTAARMLFSQVRAKKQGHRCIHERLKPGLIIGDTGDFIPFVIEEERAHQKRTPSFSILLFLKSCSNVPLSSERPKLTESKRNCCKLNHAGFRKRNR